MAKKDIFFQDNSQYETKFPLMNFLERNLYLILALVFAVFFIVAISGSHENKGTPTCGDGTFYSTCSLQKPYYCDNGTLVEKSSACKCPEGMNANGDSCTLPFFTGQKDITLKYVLRGNENELKFTVYRGVYDYASNLPSTINYLGNETPSRADFKLKDISNFVQTDAIVPLVKKIQNLAANPDDQARIAISIVQNIEWKESNETSTSLNFATVHSRRPYEVLYNGEGICGEKSELLALILKEMGYDVAIFYNQQENHESVGIKCPAENSWNNTGYCFVETSGPAIMTDTSLIYEGGIRIKSPPQVLKLSDGKSLPENLYEYSDAKTMSDITNKNLWGFLQIWKLSSLEKKYGLKDNYRIG